ncbi:hypothetical protein ACH5RR_010966 [Cinchona calisaya]|uniref:Beta-glucosidase n=1 Tax=Cinchona calisaya TaxID=153742 RepID=A0ABD3A3I6_9GENT
MISRKDFPTDFKFGCSTSALQTESSPTEGGRGPSTWDFMIGDNQIAVDSYHRYKEDVQLLKKMGADTYRFSISWTRILPDGTVSGGINQEGIDFYNNFINELIKNGITPFVTLFHFDLPTALQNKYNGFLDSRIADDFKAYADICFKNFGDRVKYWLTINEPQVFAQYGYVQGLKIPDDRVKYPFLAMHNIILAHASAFKHYKENYQPTQKGEIGMSLVTEWFLPSDESRPNRAAAERAFDFLTGWILEPLVYGDYPFIMKALVRDVLPTFTDAQKELVKGSHDFIGVNYYTSRYATDIPIVPGETYKSYDQYQHVQENTENNGKPIGVQSPGNTAIYVYPQGLGDVLEYINREYGQPKIYITENGYPEKRDDSIPVETALKDDARIQHITAHLQSVSRALKNGANVKGYFMWALMDCMEVGSYYDVRYGLNYTDYLNNLNRTPKKSSQWFQSTFSKGSN